MVSDHIKSGLLTFFFGSLGQLFARIRYLNGSLEKAWLLLFAVPPFSFISSIWFFMNWISKGTGGEVFNAFSIILPVVAIVVGLILKYSEITTHTTIANIILFAVLFAIARYMQMRTTCRLEKEELYTKNDPAVYLEKSVIMTVGTVGTLFLVGKFIVPVLAEVPVTKTVVTLLQSLDGVIPNIGYASGLFLLHTIFQMYGNTPEYQNSLCSQFHL